MNECVVRVKPVFGRAVIFNTALDSFHGHPDPLNCPPERSRRSIATYYYSAPEKGLDALPNRTTNFQARPGTQDRSDWQVRRASSRERLGTSAAAALGTPHPRLIPATGRLALAMRHFHARLRSASVISATVLSIFRRLEAPNTIDST